MGLQNFQIKFDNSTELFYPGQNVTGRIFIRIDSSKRIQGIELKIKGEAEVHWTRTKQKADSNGTRRHKTIHFNGHELYFENNFNLIPGGETTLPAGEHVYSFNVHLPANIPSSFESKLGHIRYTAKATIKRSWKFDHETKTAFTVVSPLDLNGNEIANKPVKDESHKRFCCCCCKSGPLEMIVNLPVTGYVPGQEIPITIEVDNVSNVDVDQVKCTFRKKVQFTATSPHRETRTETYDVEQVLFPGVPVGGSETNTRKLKIPALPPTDLKHCSIIDLSYQLKVSAKVSGCHRDLETRISVIIGSIPLRSFQEEVLPPREAFASTTGIGWGMQSSSTNLPSYPAVLESYPSPVQPYPPPVQSYPPAPHPYPPAPQPHPFPSQPYLPAVHQYPPPTQSSTSNSVYSQQAMPSAPPLQAYPDMPPPSYDECVFGANNIQDSEDNQYTQGKLEFAPKYPVYNFKTN